MVQRKGGIRKAGGLGGRGRIGLMDGWMDIFRIGDSMKGGDVLESVDVESPVLGVQGRAECSPMLTLETLKRR